METKPIDKLDVFKPEFSDNKWFVKTSNGFIVRHVESERHANLLASYLNSEAAKIITDCCVGGCYYCNF